MRPSERVEPRPNSMRDHDASKHARSKQEQHVDRRKLDRRGIQLENLHRESGQPRLAVHHKPVLGLESLHSGLNGAEEGLDSVKRLRKRGGEDSLVVVAPLVGDEGGEAEGAQAGYPLTRR